MYLFILLHDSISTSTSLGNLAEIIPVVVAKCTSTQHCIHALNEVFVRVLSDSRTATINMEASLVDKWDSHFQSKSGPKDSPEGKVMTPIRNFLDNWNLLASDPELLDWYHRSFPHQLFWLMIANNFHPKMKTLRERLSLSPSPQQIQTNSKTRIQGNLKCSVVESFFENLIKDSCKAIARVGESCSSDLIFDSVKSDFLLTVGLLWKSDGAVRTRFLPSVDPQSVTLFFSKFASLCQVYNLVIDYLSSPFLPFSHPDPTRVIEGLISHGSPVADSEIATISSECLSNLDGIVHGCYREKSEQISWLLTQEPKNWKSSRDLFKSSIQKLDDTFYQTISYIDSLTPVRRRSYLISKSEDFSKIISRQPDNFLFQYGDDRAKPLLAENYEKLEEYILSLVPKCGQSGTCSELRFELAINSARLVAVLRNPQVFSDESLLKNLFPKFSVPIDLLEKWKDSVHIQAMALEEVYAAARFANGICTKYISEILESEGDNFFSKTKWEDIPIFFALNRLLNVHGPTSRFGLTSSPKHRDEKPMMTLEDMESGPFFEVPLDSPTSGSPSSSKEDEVDEVALYSLANGDDMICSDPDFDYCVQISFAFLKSLKTDMENNWPVLDWLNSLIESYIPTITSTVATAGKFLSSYIPAWLLQPAASASEGKEGNFI